MNYFGHAYLAELERPDTLFILGAMLPDLAGLAKMRPPTRSGDEALGQGVQFHHACDRAFHQHAEFQAGQRDLVVRLTEHRVRKGPARAMAHIGIEFLIDAGLCEDRAIGYLEALKAGASPGTFGQFQEAERARLQGVCAYLFGRGLAPFQVSEPQLAVRLERTLAHRPKLAPSQHELKIAARELAGLSREWSSRAIGLAGAVLERVHTENWQNGETTGTLWPDDETEHTG